MLIKQYYSQLRRTGILVLAMLFSVSSLLFVFDGRAIAFSGSGTGTAGDPYQITSCAEWQEINDELSAHYILMNDIDCSADGSDVTIGDQILAFTGVLDGNNNRVTIGIDDPAFPYDVAGLFNYLGGEVRNLEIAGLISTESSTGALAGYAEYSTIDNVHITADVHGAAKTGGMIGEASNVTITNSSVTGDVSGNNNTGGIVGIAYSSILSNLRFAGNVAGDDLTAGIVGEFIEGTLTRTGVTGAISGRYSVGGLAGYAYSTTPISQSFTKGSVHADTEVGGVVGTLDMGTKITDSYSQSDVTATGSTVGGIVGYGMGYGELTNVYASGAITGVHNSGLISIPLGITCKDSFWDSRDGTSPVDTACTISGATSMQSTAQMKNKFTYTANPSRVEAWDFNSIWGINPAENDGYPFLWWESYTNDAPGDQDSVPDAVENAAPNSGDANYNEIPDAQEGHVVSLPSADPTKYVTLTLNEESCYFASVSVDPADDMPVQDSAYHYPGGIMSFTVQCPSPGMELTVSIFMFDFDFTDAEVRKFNTTSNTYSTINDTVHANQVDSTSFHFSSYAIQDGGSLDMDGETNGVIIDPVGIGQKVAASSPSGQGEQNTGITEPGALSDTGTNLIFIMLSAFGIISISALLWAVSRQNHSKLHAK